VRATVRPHALLAEVVEVERAQALGDLAAAGVRDVVDVRERRRHVRRRLVQLTGRRLGRRQVLEEPPEEPEVEGANGMADRQVVQLLGGEALERIVVGGAHHFPRRPSPPRR
jgi:hypothetical protein